MACEPCAWPNQCGDTASLMPAFLAVRLTLPLTARSVRWPPLRLQKTESLAPASPRKDRSDRLTMSGRIHSRARAVGGGKCDYLWGERRQKARQPS
jgi:hypothetical protein